MARLLIRLLRSVPPETRLTAAAWMIILATAAWPISAFTIARHEPPFILGLSWLAIIVTAVDIIVTADVRQEQEDGPSGSSS